MKKAPISWMTLQQLTACSAGLGLAWLDLLWLISSHTLLFNLPAEQALTV